MISPGTERSAVETAFTIGSCYFLQSNEEVVLFGCCIIFLLSFFHALDDEIHHRLNVSMAGKAIETSGFPTRK
jgi:hypothetical protein